MTGAGRGEGHPVHVRGPAAQRRRRRPGCPSGARPLAHQDQEVVAEGDQARTAREALSDWHGRKVGLGQVVSGVEEGPVEDGAQQGVAGGK